MEKKNFADLVSTEKSKVHELMAFRKANKQWLKKSMAIAIRVLNELRDKKISQVELARKMEVSPQYVNKILKGSENLTLETITKLESILEVNLVSIPNTQITEAYPVAYENVLAEPISNLASLRETQPEGYKPSGPEPEKFD